MPATEIKAKDLTTEFPRSGNEPLGGYLGLARAVDKGRALLAGKVGEYHYNCPLDQAFFRVSGVDADALKDFLATGADDDAVAAWVDQHSTPHSAEDLQRWNDELRSYGPDAPEKWEYYNSLRDQVAPG